MAVQTIYLLGTVGVTPNFWGNTQLNGSAPTAANSAFGWKPAKTAVTTPYYRARIGATAVSGTAAVASSVISGATGPTPGTGTGATTASDSFVVGPLSGTFASSTWTFNFNLRASTAGAIGRLNLKVWRSVNADGSSPTALGTWFQGSQVTLSTTADVNSVTTFNPGVLVLSSAYLFFQVEWQETTAGSSNNNDVLFRIGTASITTSDFVAAATATLNVTQANQTVSAVGGPVVNGQLGADTTTVLLVHADGTNGSTTFTDSSSGPHTLTSLNNARVSTAAPKFGTGAADFTAASTAAIDTNNAVDFNLGSGPFTIGAWGYFTSTPSGVSAIVSQVANVTSNYGWQFYYSPGGGGFLAFGASSTGASNDSNLSTTSGVYIPPLTTWIHFVAERDASNVLRLYVNGTVVASKTITGTIFPSTLTGYIGNDHLNASVFPGYLDEIRVTKRALYGGPFTPPTAPFDLATQITQQDNTVVAAGNVPLSSVTGTLNRTEIDDTFVGTGGPIVGGTLNRTEINDTFVGAGGPIVGGTLNCTQDANTFNLIPDQWILEAGVTFTGNGNPYSLIEDATNGPHYLDQELPPIPDVGEYCMSFEFEGVGPTPRSGSIDIYDSYSGANAVELVINPNGTIFAADAVGSVFVVHNATVTAKGDGFWDARIYFSQLSSFVLTAEFYLYAGSQYLYQGLNDGSGVQFRNTAIRARAGGPVVGGTLNRTEIDDTLSATASVSGGSDVVLLCHFDNAPFVDVSTYHHTLTATNVTVSTPNPKFGTGCGYWTFGSLSANINTGSASDFWFDAGPFTIEAWCYPNSPATGDGYNPILAEWDAVLGNVSFFFNVFPQVMFFWSPDGTAYSYVASGNAPSLNAWHHVAVDRDASNILRLYLDGVVVGSGTCIGGFYHSSYHALIGNDASLGRAFPGALDEIRVIRGTAMYGGAFTPPTAPFLPVEPIPPITATLNLPQANQTLVAAGGPRVGGTLNANQVANTIAATAGSIVSGTLSQPQAAQTIAASGGPRVGGILNTSQAAQTISSTAGPVVGGSLIVPQAAQTLSAAGGPRVGGTLNVNQAAQTIVATAGSVVSGTLSQPQAAQTLVGSGSVVTGASGSLIATQANQTLVATGTSPFVGTLNVLQANQTLVATSTVVVRGTLNTNQAANTITATAVSVVGGVLNVNQAANTVTATGTIAVRGTLSQTQAANTLVASGTVPLVGIGGSLNQVQANQTLTATGGPVVRGTLNVNQAANTVTATGASIVAGTLVQSQAANTVTATGAVIVTGTLVQPQAANTIAATVNVTVRGLLTETQDSQTLVAIALGGTSATLVKTQADNTLVAAGRVVSRVPPTMPIYSGESNGRYIVGEKEDRLVASSANGRTIVSDPQAYRSISGLAPRRTLDSDGR